MLVLVTASLFLAGGMALAVLYGTRAYLGLQCPGFWAALSAGLARVVDEPGRVSARSQAQRSGR